MVAELIAKLEPIFNDLVPDDYVPTRERTRVNCVRWDSLAQLNVVLAVEQAFQIRLSDEDVVDINSFASALQVIQNKLSSPSPEPR